ncbi:unnamed protein product [Allacma fusca]|uniref:Defensin-like protein n=1 Tax=Allacma fusca TaxID=39272 RepID=A0A8J2L962_9HEXA|nr:unnamed protein product [Allacma fusca]
MMHPALQMKHLIIPNLVLIVLNLIKPIDNANETIPTGFRQGRWGMFFTYEPICTLACRKNGKFSGRMYGGVCRCYCPRSEKLPCTGTYPSCERLCRQNAYDYGGDCLDDTTCYCYCTVRQRQAPNGTEPSTTGAPCSPNSTPPSGSGSANAPSPGSLGQTRTGIKSSKKSSRRRHNSTKRHKIQDIELHQKMTTETPEVQNAKPDII